MAATAAIGADGRHNTQAFNSDRSPGSNSVSDSSGSCQRCAPSLAGVTLAHIGFLLAGILVIVIVTMMRR